MNDDIRLERPIDLTIASLDEDVDIVERDKQALEPVRESLRAAGFYAYTTYDDQQRWTVAVDDELARIDVRVGMEPDDLAQACNAFYRGRSAGIAEAEGIGLGVAISRHMAELMQVDLRISSIPGSGTRVTVRLPLAHEERKVPPRAALDRGEALLRGRLVAVVENDRIAREARCCWLLEAGARVAQAASLRQLREVLRNADAPPDLVLADYSLSDGTGVEAVEAVRATYGWVPAWIFSGEPEIATRGLELPVLQKPITPERLLDALAAAFPGGTAARSARV